MTRWPAVVATTRWTVARVRTRRTTAVLQVAEDFEHGMALVNGVRQGLLASVESYSIKRIEPLYALTREQDLKDAGSSIVAFESWLEMGEDTPVEDAAKVLDGIAAYNRDDVVSNWRLRDWLEERRRDLEVREGRQRGLAAGDAAPGLPVAEGGGADADLGSGGAGDHGDGGGDYRAFGDSLCPAGRFQRADIGGGALAGGAVCAVCRAEPAVSVRAQSARCAVALVHGGRWHRDCAVNRGVGGAVLLSDQLCQL